MLVELRIGNFAVIREAELEFGAGLNVLSGETGAGKTIIMSALGLLLGIRASPEMVRSGANEAFVEGLFEVEGESLAEFPHELSEVADGAGNSTSLLVRRTISEGGRSRALINGSLATVQMLARLGAGLVQVYGQHEQQTLLRPESHRQILDRYAGLDGLLSRYGAAYERAANLKSRLEDLARSMAERSSLLELARFRVTELERAKIQIAEDDDLARERGVLANAARLAQAAGEAQALLDGADGAAIDTIARAQTRLADAAAIDPALSSTADLLTAARANVDEAARALADYCGNISANPERLEQIEARLQELTRLKRKYGGSIAAALETLEHSRAEIATLENVAEDCAAAERELDGALAALAEVAGELSERRRRSAAELGRSMASELKSLGMKNAAFDARVSGLDADEARLAYHDKVFGPGGADTVEFHLSPNLGQPPMPLAKIASGGELSRVMLSLKRLEAAKRGLPTMIFDEVDAGIGGEVAQVVGRKLKQLARFHQVLCVTHLPQIAACADRHFLVEKKESKGATISSVTALPPDRRADEIARMLGGAVSDKLLRAAHEMIERAQE
jgi:DNA repair protein RecN (Recombination protein N)